MAHTPLDQHILNLLEENGEMLSRDIYATKPEVNEHTIRSRIGKLKNEGKIEKVKNGVYRKPASSPDAQTQYQAARKKFHNNARTAEHNEETIDALLNTYDEVLVIFQVWVLESMVSQKINFEQKLLFIENFKWLTAIADKLMKRWSLVHVGYDTNTRQAQEDAKAKTEERQKAAIKEAPLEEQVNVIGSFDLDTKELIDGFPTLESLTKEEAEEIKV